MTYQELQQAYNYWQGQYNMSCQNPQLSQVTMQAYNNMQELARAMQQFQSNVGYGNQQPIGYQQPYNNGVGYYPAQNVQQQQVGYYPPQQQNFNAGVNFGKQLQSNPVPSMQVPNAGDRHSEGRYQKLVSEKYGNMQQKQFQPIIQQQVQPVQQPVVPTVPAKPTKFIQGHKWSYLCSSDKQCIEEIQGDYISYKVQPLSGRYGLSEIDDMTDENQEAVCPEKAANKYAYLTNTQAAFVDLKFSKTFTTFDLKEILEAVVDDDKTSDEGAKKVISDVMASKKSNEDNLTIVTKLYIIGQYVDHRYSGIFNSVARSAFELGLKVGDTLTDYEEILETVRSKYDERVYANITKLITTLKKNALEKDKFSITFVEGEKETDTYLKVKWDYQNKGMYVDYSLFTEIENEVSIGTIDKGKSEFYKITSLSNKHLYDILNAGKIEEGEIVYMFSRGVDGNFVAYEIIKGDVGTFYFRNNKFNL